MRCGGKTPKMPPGFVAIMEDHSGSRCCRRPALISSPTSHVGRSTTPQPATGASRRGSPPARAGGVGAQGAGDGACLESISCLVLATKEPTIGRLQRIDQTVVL